MPHSKMPWVFNARLSTNLLSNRGSDMMKKYLSKHALAIVLTATVLGVAVPAHAGLTLVTNTDTLAGRNAFVAAGTTQTLFDWNSSFSSGVFTPGSLGPVHHLATYTTPALPGGAVNQADGRLALGNWIDGDVFDSNTGAAADLAINGNENFGLLFGVGHRSIGLAIASGTGNLPTDYDLNGAQFKFSAFDANNKVVGSAELTLAAGSPQRLWLTLNSDSDFRRIEVQEIGNAHQNDQYFSNIYTSVEQVSAVPEPETYVMMLAGLGLMGAIARRRKAKQSA